MSATYFECHGCGVDCSQAYATHDGYPYHFGCLPRKPKHKPKEYQPLFGLTAEEKEIE